MGERARVERDVRGREGREEREDPTLGALKKKRETRALIVHAESREGAGMSVRVESRSQKVERVLAPEQKGGVCVCVEGENEGLVLSLFIPPFTSSSCFFLGRDFVFVSFWGGDLRHPSQ